MDARRFHALAEQLVKRVQKGGPLCGGLCDVDCRTAVSRAYYAAFLVAREYLESQLGFVLTEKGACHVALQKALKASKHSAVVVIGVSLSSLYSQRLDADYDM